METSRHVRSVLREFETVDDMCIKSHLEKIEQQLKECIYHHKLALEKLDFLINFMTSQPQPHHQGPWSRFSSAGANANALV